MRHVTVQDLRELRQRTGAGVMECREALEATAGHMEQATELLRREALAEAEKRATRHAGEGQIGTYIHHNNKLAVIVEVNCETDFVARTDDFQTLARQLAQHIAAAAPVVVAAGDLAADVLREKRRESEEQVRTAGTPEEQVTGVADERLAAFLRDVVLLEQSWVRDPSRTIGDIVKEVSSKLGEHVRVRRFARLRIGE